MRFRWPGRAVKSARRSRRVVEVRLSEQRGHALKRPTASNGGGLFEGSTRDESPPFEKNAPFEGCLPEQSRCPCFGIDRLSNAQGRPRLRIAGPTVRAGLATAAGGSQRSCSTGANRGCHVCAEILHDTGAAREDCTWVVLIAHAESLQSSLSLRVWLDRRVAREIRGVVHQFRW